MFLNTDTCWFLLGGQARSLAVVEGVDALGLAVAVELMAVDTVATGGRMTAAATGASTSDIPAQAAGTVTDGSLA